MARKTKPRPEPLVVTVNDGPLCRACKAPRPAYDDRPFGWDVHLTIELIGLVRRRKTWFSTCSPACRTALGLTERYP